MKTLPFVLLAFLAGAAISSPIPFFENIPSPLDDIPIPEGGIDLDKLLDNLPAIPPPRPPLPEMPLFSPENAAVTGLWRLHHPRFNMWVDYSVRTMEQVRYAAKSCDIDTRFAVACHSVPFALRASVCSDDVAKEVSLLVDDSAALPRFLMIAQTLREMDAVVVPEVLYGTCLQAQNIYPFVGDGDNIRAWTPFMRNTGI